VEVLMSTSLMESVNFHSWNN